MNIVLWVAAGSVLAWIGYSYLGLDKGRSLPISIAIGVAGALLGGVVVAPRFAEFAIAPGLFSLTDLLFAMCGAVVCLVLDCLLFRRWGVQ
jgi:uncharacterized membrane protein YeaQ/YmgE (transglycosylase-associated protein family)